MDYSLPMATCQKQAGASQVRQMASWLMTSISILAHAVVAGLTLQSLMIEYMGLFVVGS